MTTTPRDTLKALRLQLANAYLQKEINYVKDHPEFGTREEDLDKDQILYSASESIASKFKQCLFNLYAANISSGDSEHIALNKAQHQLIHFIKWSEGSLPTPELVHDETWFDA